MAKKSGKKSTSKKDDKRAGAKQDDARAKRKAEEAAAKKAAKRADELAAEAKKARKAADKAAKAADKAEVKSADAGKAAGRPGTAEKPDELSLAKLALRSAEAKLTAAEMRAEQLQQQLADERRLQDEAVSVVLEDAIVDAAVQATVEEAVADAIVEAETLGDLDDAVVVEAVATDLDATSAEADLPPEEPSHEGEAEDAAQVFTESDSVDEPAVVASESTPPLPVAPSPDEPSEQWTLLKLREEAKRRGLTGTSTLPKAALLERLRSS